MPLDLDRPGPSPVRAPVLGIVSGKAMSELRLPPSVWGLPDNSETSSEIDLVNLLIGPASRNPTQPAQSPDAGRPERSLGRRIAGQPQDSVFDTGAPAMPFVPSGALLAPDRQDAFRQGDGAFAPMLPSPPSDGSMASILMDRIRTLNERDRRNAQAPFSDTGAPMAPFASPDGPTFSNRLGNFGAEANIDTEGPTQLAQPPLDDDEKQANLRALDARLSSTGDMRDAVALYNARRVRRSGTFIS